MSIVRGVSISEVPCCGAQYAFPMYFSMNFSAFEYWTDGWRYGSLMPDGEGLRRCRCGQFVLIRDMLKISTADSSNFPRIGHVTPDLLSECIASASSEKVEVAARLEYWRHLNHPYRDQYRKHRDAEEAATEASWKAANPDRRTLWDKLRGRKAKIYVRPKGSPFTCPKFEPSVVQLQNMERLSDILQTWEELSYWKRIELAELYREQSRFDEAAKFAEKIPYREDDVTINLIIKFINEKQSAPIRYMLD